MTATEGVCVIIAAFNARRTVARAIRSALAEPEVAEVVVVDDASTDGTAEAVRAADDGSGRLRYLRQATNRGPSAARNRAIAESEAPYLAILDADDMVLPGRFARLLADSAWDAIADNIAFVVESDSDALPSPAVEADERRALTLAGFVQGNISRPSRPRGELAFVKPVIRRAFLDRHGLRYDETMRLGEDYILYARMLVDGARFVVTRACGYLALERADSLSGRHRTEDLAALLEADRRLLTHPRITSEDRAVLSRHVDQVAARHHHRRVLDIRRARGRWTAVRAAAARPSALPALIGSVLRDKVTRPAAARDAGEIRYLFD